jgi:N-acetylmuramoyl-L-alanine amidase
VSYRIIAGNKQLEGMTDQNGKLEEMIPANLQTVRLEVGAARVPWNLAVGHLDPIHDLDVITGLQARLNNLGFPCGAVDGVLGPKTRAAIRQFQTDVLRQANPSGDADEETRRALKDSHGC